MTNYDFLITVASWEDRFRLGMERILTSSNITQTLVYYYEEYALRTEANRAAVRNMCRQDTIPDEHSLLFSDPLGTWKTLEKDIASRDAGQHVLLDISTMPRDTIWNLLYLLEQRNHTISYLYNKPAGYSSTWLSRDPGRPRLAFNQSGIAKLGCSTVLIITTGFDAERTGQLVTFFEPKLVFLAMQEGTQFDNDRKNLDPHRNLDLPKDKVESFQFDAYSADHGLSILTPYVERYSQSDNVVMSSLGPKPSAIALYQAKKRFPEAALAYAPSNDFNIDYSSGIGDSIMGQIK